MLFVSGEKNIILFFSLSLSLLRINLFNWIFFCKNKAINELKIYKYKINLE